MKTAGVKTFKVAATYIGTVVGAGFASGQEILQFFTVFGSRGLIGLIIATILFVIFGYIVMELGSKVNSKSHLEIVKFSGGKYLGPVLDFVITFFLFGALTAMIAGSGAMFTQQFKIPAFWGTLLMAVITAVTVLAGINGVINSISFVVPFLLITAVGLSIGAIITTPAANNVAVQQVTSTGLVKNWLWASILYISYNMVLAVAVLGPLGAKASGRKSIRNGAILGGLGLGIGAIAIYFALLKNVESVRNIEIPMAFIAGKFALSIQIIYVVVLLAEVYTTAVGSLFGFSARVYGKRGKKGTLIIGGVTLFAFIAAQFGFSNLVKYMFPIVGYAGVVMLGALLYAKYRIRTAGQKS